MKKSIYFYWGNGTMSYMRYMSLYSFCTFNPSWKVNLIENKLPSNRPMNVTTVEVQDKTEYTGPDYSDYLDTLPIKRIPFNVNTLDLPEKVVYNMSDVHIKDLLNWKLLSEGKGFVADMDILFIAPLFIDAITEVGLICFDNYPQKDYIPVSFMYASKPTLFFKKTYERALINYDPAVYESCGTLCIKENNINEIKTRYPDTHIIKLPEYLVFPLTEYSWADGMSMLYKGNHMNNLHKKSVGIHWYGGTPESQQFNNIINEETFKGSLSIINTMTLKVKEVLCQSHNNQ